MLASAWSDDEKKRLGIYYTPNELAQELVDWALRSPADTVLEPSFGGCNFLRASHSRLSALGAADPLRQICGTDIDKRALDSLSDAFGMVDIQRRFLLNDFLATDRAAFCIDQFDAVVGNPPYVSHHAMSAEQKAVAWLLAHRNGWTIPKTASLWAYFVLHSLTFCKPGARLAFVLPPAVLLANYASALRATIDASFEHTTFRPLSDRIFRDQGTEERSILLLADGYRGMNLTFDTSAVETRTTAIRRGMLEADVAKTFDEVLSASVMFGSCADVRIGTVTGANQLFVITPEVAEENAFSDEMLVPALARIPKNHGLSYGEDDHVRAVAAGARCYIVHPPAQPMSHQPHAVRRYFSTYEAEAIEQNRTFKKRPLWFVIDDIDDPDAFLSYMHHEAPTLILNKTRAVCTNNIHRIWWKSHVSARDRKLIAVSFLSTFTQLSAELEGRTYGGGVLKHEIGEARRIRLLLPKSLPYNVVDRAYEEIDDYLRRGLRGPAVSAADTLLISGLHGLITKRAISRLSVALGRLRQIRTVRR